MTQPAPEMPSEMPPEMPPEILRLGLDALVVRFATAFSAPANRAARALAAALAQAPLPGQCEVAGGLGSVLIRFARHETSAEAVQAALQARLAAPESPDPAATAAETGRRWRVPAAFGGASGPHLAELSQITGRSETALIVELCATELQVLALGFAPGQPYLGLLPEPWQVPRRAALTPHVPPGTITAALRQIVLFAAPSPTGWHVLGRAALRPFAPEAARPFLLLPGDRLRFQPADAAEIDALAAKGDPAGGARLEFLK